MSISKIRRKSEGLFFFLSFVYVCVLLQKNPISFVEIYSDTFLWMPLTSFSTTNPFKLAGGDEERHRERKPRGKKKRKKKRWRILRSHLPPSSPPSVHKTNRQKNYNTTYLLLFFFGRVFSDFFPLLFRRRSML